MPARHVVLLTLSADSDHLLWSYRYTGTLPRLISFLSHSYENTRGGGYSSHFGQHERCSSRELPAGFKFFLFNLLRTLLYLFALTKNSTLFFPIVSALFAKKKHPRAWASSNLRPSTFNSQSSALHVQFPPRVPGRVMTFSQRFDEVRTGFERPFSLVKPCVVGTTARASKENVRSIGYSIYYTLVNIGGFIGPLVASYVHKNLSVENVFRAAAVSVFLMFFAVLLFFKEPTRSNEKQTASLGETLRNFVKVITNPKFMPFLLIFSGYCIVYWQEFYTLPPHVPDYRDPKARTQMMLATRP